MNIASDVPAPQGAPVPVAQGGRVPIKRWERLGMSRGELVMSVLTLGVVVIAFAALKDAHDASRVDQRAWVGVSSGQLVIKPLVAGARPSYTLNFTNSGKTPALNVVLTGGQTVQGNAMDFDPALQLLGRAPVPWGVLQPGGKGKVDPIIDHALTTEEVDQLNDGALIFRFFGHITYEDIYQQKHATDYCFKVDLPGPTFVSCDTFNSAD